MSQYKIQNFVLNNQSLVPFRKSRKKYFCSKTEGILFLNKDSLLGIPKVKNQLEYEKLADSSQNRSIELSGTKSWVNSLVADARKENIFVCYSNGELEKYQISKLGFSLDLFLIKKIATNYKSDFSCIFLNSFLFCSNKLTIDLIDYKESNFTNLCNKRSFKFFNSSIIWNNKSKKKWYILCIGKFNYGESKLFCKVDITNYIDFNKYSRIQDTLKNNPNKKLKDANPSLRNLKNNKIIIPS